MWDFVVTDKLGNRLGELSGKGRERSVRMPLNGPRSAGCRVEIDHPLAGVLTDAGRTCILAYRDGELMFNGPVVTFEESSSDQNNTLAIVAMDAAWRINQLLLGKSTAGYSFGTALAPAALDAIAEDILTSAGATSTLHGVDIGATSSSATGYVGPWHYKSALEALQEISGTLDGFDWQILPIAETGNQIIGEFVCSDYIGAQQQDAVFEYGDGKRNVESYRRVGSADGLLNAAYSLPAGFPDADPAQTLQTSEDAAAIAEYGRRETVVDTDLAVDALRLKLLQEHVRIRKAPRQTIEFTPTTVDDPAYGDDYGLGDVVGFRATQAGEKRIDVEMRIYAIDFSIDDDGVESKQLTLAQG